MPNFSLNDMPWLLQTADAGGSLAKGAAVGQAISANRARRDTIRMQREQFAQELPLRQAASKADLLRAGAQAAEFVLKQNDQEASGLFGALVADIAGRQAWADPASEQSLWAFTERYPQVAEKDGFKAVLERMKVARDAAERAKPLTVPPAPPGMSPSSITAQTPQGSVTFRSPDPGEVIESTPEGGFRILRGGAALTTQTQAAQEQKVFGAKAALAAGSRLRTLITPETVGIKGAFNRLYGQLGGQFPGIFGDVSKIQGVDDAQKYVAALRNYQSNLVKAMRTDSQISETERKFWLGAGPTIELNDSVPAALTRLQELQEAAIKSLRNSAVELKRPIPIEGLYPAEVFDRYTKGELTFPELSEALLSSPFREEAQSVATRLRELASPNGRP